MSEQIIILDPTLLWRQEILSDEIEWIQFQSSLRENKSYVGYTNMSINENLISFMRNKLDIKTKQIQSTTKTTITSPPRSILRKDIETFETEERLIAENDTYTAGHNTIQEDELKLDNEVFVDSNNHDKSIFFNISKDSQLQYSSVVSKCSSPSLCSVSTQSITESNSNSSSISDFMLEENEDEAQ